MLNRRQFIIGAGTVLAAATGCSRVRLKLPASGESPRAEDEGPRPFRVALLSDPHTVESGALHAVAVNGKLSRAVADYKPLRPDLWVVNGDIADTGKSAQLAAFKKIMGAVAGPGQLLVNTGNHDYYDQDASDAEELQRFREAFGQEQAYSSRVAGGIHIVMLADEQYKTAPGAREWAWLTPEQLRWFEQVLEEHKDKFTVVCLHQPLQDTVVWSFGGNDFAGCGQRKELRAITKKNPQIKLWFSGHTHMGADIAGNAARLDGVVYAGLGSTFYQFVKSDEPDDQGGWPSDGGFKKDLAASHSRMLEVWPDRAVLRARDHTNQAWLDRHEIIINRSA
ncbi:MAG TPA: metallophosphoesterase [Symbiobacteriaceae bacterium]|nr:metallophosphoesterase [Symbiobacteriaceae bacterium]